MNEPQSHTQTDTAQHADEPFNQPAELMDITGHDSPEAIENERHEMEDEVQLLQTALRETQEQLLRLQADFQNYRKRRDKEMGDLITYANERVIQSLLPVLDDFDRSLAVMDKSDNVSSIKEGISGVNRNMRHIFEKLGVESFSAVGEVFDPALHEAITTVPAPDPSMVGKVMDEIKKGYRLKDKVIRFSQVIVGE